jgi:hypothetical protein
MSADISHETVRGQEWAFLGPALWVFASLGKLKLASRACVPRVSPTIVQPRALFIIISGAVLPTVPTPRLASLYNCET